MYYGPLFVWALGLLLGTATFFIELCTKKRQEDPTIIIKTAKNGKSSSLSDINGGTEEKSGVHGVVYEDFTNKNCIIETDDIP